MAAHILHTNLLSAGSAVELTATGFDAGWEFANALNIGTALKAQVLLGVVGVAEYDLGVIAPISSVAIARHNFGTANANIKVSVASNQAGPWSVLVDHSPIDDDVLLVVEPVITGRYVRVEVQNHTQAAIFSVVCVGDALKLPRSMPNGFIPPEFGAQDQVTASYTAGTELAGLSIKRQPAKTRAIIKEAPRKWFFDNWRELQVALLKNTVFFRWKETGSTLYGTLASKKSPNPKFVKTYYMTVNIDFQGFIS